MRSIRWIPVVALLSLGILASVSLAAPPQWTPAKWAQEETIELMTTGPDEGAYWFPVWLVIVDDQLYVRLGNRAATRVRRNTTAPYLKARIAGQEFDRVRVDEAPDKIDAVAEAMGKKYFTDLLIRHFPHPMTLRLAAE